MKDWADTRRTAEGWGTRLQGMARVAECPGRVAARGPGMAVAAAHWVVKGDMMVAEVAEGEVRAGAGILMIQRIACLI